MKQRIVMGDAVAQAVLRRDKARRNEPDEWMGEQYEGDADDDREAGVSVTYRADGSISVRAIGEGYLPADVVSGLINAAGGGSDTT